MPEPSTAPSRAPRNRSAIRALNTLRNEVRLLRAGCTALRSELEGDFLDTNNDSDDAVLRCMCRRLEEAVGERRTFLLKEEPGGRWLYAQAHRAKRVEAGFTLQGGASPKDLLRSERLLLLSALLESLQLVDSPSLDPKDSLLSIDYYWEPERSGENAPWALRRERYESALGRDVLALLGATPAERKARREMVSQEVREHVTKLSKRASRIRAQQGRQREEQRLATATADIHALLEQGHD